MFCENCGMKLNDDDLFCASCGAKVQREETAEPEPIAESIPTADSIPVAESVPAAENTPAVSEYLPDENQQNEYLSRKDISYYTSKSANAPKNNAKSNKGLIITISVCGAVLLILIGVLLFVLLGSDDSKTEVQDKGTIVQNDDDDIFGKDDEDDKDDLEEKKQELKEKLKKSIKKIDGNTVSDIVASDNISTRYGIYMKNLSNGYTYEYNADDIFNSSAMCQVVILDTLFKECVDHNIDINTAGMNFIYLDNGKMVPGSSSQDGQYFTIRQYAEAVAEYGDNNRSNQLVDYIASINGTGNGFDIINSTLRKNGHTNTLISRKIYTGKQQHLIDKNAPVNRTTPSEIAEIYYDFIYNKSIDDPEYLKNICKSIDINNQPIGFKKFVSPEYKVYNVNAFNTQCSNNVAIISNGKTDILVSILSETPEGIADATSGDKRDPIINRLINYIVQVQFQ